MAPSVHGNRKDVIPVLAPILLGVGSAVTTSIGGLVAMRIADRRHIVLGLAGGVVLGVVIFDLLPEAFGENHTQWLHLPAVTLLFAAGFLTIHIVEKVIELHRHAHYATHEHDLRPLGMLAGGALVGHSFLDGLGIGVSAAAGAAVLTAVAVAVLTHDFADGFNTYTLTSMYGNDRRRAVAFLVGDALAPIAGAAIGSTLIQPSPSTVGLYLAYFAGFLLHIATGSILPEAHADHPAWGTLGATIGGVAVMAVVMAFMG